MHLSRTEKGHEEIFNQGHSLRPKQRQILFAIGNGIACGELRSKLPNCVELQEMVRDLLQNGFIQAQSDGVSAEAAPLASNPIVPPPAKMEATLPVTESQPADSLTAGRNYVLEFMARLVGTKSPAYRQMSEVRDLAGFNAVLPMCRKVIAAVASPHQAAEMEAGALEHIAG
jgi:hypothetical protein